MTPFDRERSVGCRVFSRNLLLQLLVGNCELFERVVLRYLTIQLLAQVLAFLSALHVGSHNFLFECLKSEKKTDKEG